MNESDRIEKLERKFGRLLEAFVLQQQMLQEMFSVLANVVSKVDGVPNDFEPLPVLLTPTQRKLEHLKKLLDSYNLPEGEKPQ